MPDIVGLRILLIVEERRSDQEVREVGTGFLSLELERTVGDRIRIDVHLFIGRLETGFERMVAEDSGKVVVQAPGIIRLLQICYRNTDREGIECDRLDTLD